MTDPADPDRGERGRPLHSTGTPGPRLDTRRSIIDSGTRPRCADEEGGPSGPTPQVGKRPGAALVKAAARRPALREFVGAGRGRRRTPPKGAASTSNVGNSELLRACSQVG